MSSLSPTATPFIQALPVQQFWASIDAAWDSVDGKPTLDILIEVERNRDGTEKRDKDGHLVYDKVKRGHAVGEIRALLTSMMESLEQHLGTLSAAEVRAWHRRLYLTVRDLNNGHVEMALGTDTPEKFLHARAFVVSCGKNFYEEFKRHRNPECFSLGWVWPEDMMNLAKKVYTKRYGTLEYPPPNEPVSNADIPSTPSAAGYTDKAGDIISTPASSPTKTLVGTPGDDVKIYDASSSDKEGRVHLTAKALEYETAHGGECGVENEAGEDDDGGW